MPRLRKDFYPAESVSSILLPLDRARPARRMRSYSMFRRLIGLRRIESILIRYDFRETLISTSRSHAPRGNAVLAAPAAAMATRRWSVGLAPTLERGNEKPGGLNSRSHALRGNAVLAAPAARMATRRWSVGTCSHAGAWEPESETRLRAPSSERPSCPIFEHGSIRWKPLGWPAASFSPARTGCFGLGTTPNYACGQPDPQRPLARDRCPKRRDQSEQIDLVHHPGSQH